MAIGSWFGYAVARRPSDPVGLESEGKFVRVVQQAFDAMSDGRKSMVLQQLVEVDVGVRPPDRYAALVEAAVETVSQLGLFGGS